MNLGQKSMICVLILFSFVITACQDEKGAGDWSGVSDLIGSRNKARHEANENPPKKTARPRKVSAKSNTAPNIKKNEELSSIILYEEDVKIVGSDSQRTLAKGVAYINKKGQIVRIKILKE